MEERDIITPPTTGITTVLAQRSRNTPRTTSAVVTWEVERTFTLQGFLETIKAVWLTTEGLMR